MGTGVIYKTLNIISQRRTSMFNIAYGVHIFCLVLKFAILVVCNFNCFNRTMVLLIHLKTLHNINFRGKWGFKWGRGLWTVNYTSTQSFLISKPKKFRYFLGNIDRLIQTEVVIFISIGASINLSPIVLSLTPFRSYSTPHFQNKIHT